ncbi:hypothetical protein NQ314_017354 [Rhamnusium bicolor]|uniref:Uncharacterized protein n=1 Tax=Rhamnusium bicolor TaxID=1586634 RepID=A0AAV8WTL4_9CUCU|nr:hypothetical protein NQ314_017354 [Rhamnusium bicolor]
MALQGYNDCFLSIDPEDDAVVANVKRAGPDQFIKIRSQTVKEDNPLKDVPTEEQGNIGQIEINYV